MKKMLLGISILGIFIALSGCSYYNDTYKSEIVYSIVPETVPEKEQTKDLYGEKVEGTYSYNYTLTMVNENGEKEKREVEVSSQNPVPLEPGSYVTAKMSKKRITEGPVPIDEEKIPEKVRNLLKSNE